MPGLPEFAVPDRVSLAAGLTDCATIASGLPTAKALQMNSHESYKTRSGDPERVRGRKYHQHSPNTPEGLAAPAGSTGGDAGTPR